MNQNMVLLVLLVILVVIGLIYSGNFIEKFTDEILLTQDVSGNFLITNGNNSYYKYRNFPIPPVPTNTPKKYNWVNTLIDNGSCSLVYNDVQNYAKLPPNRFPVPNY